MIILLLMFVGLLSSFSVIVIDVAILAHSCSVQLLVGTFPRFFDSSVSVIAVCAHSFGIVRSILVATVIEFFSI